MSVKHKMRMEQVARYRVAGLKDAAIASLVGLTQAGLAVLVSSPEYKELENAIFTGQISDLDRALAGKVKAIQEEARVAVPAALRTLVEACNQRRDLKTALAAAKTIIEIDPDKTFSPSEKAEDGVPKISPDFLKNIVGEAEKVAKEAAKLPN